jgi:phosphoenolpyruvate carboxykinase (GTP)
MSDYFAHWLKLGRRDGAVLPRIYYVNWFRKDDEGKFIWPGFGENSRVLAWIFRRGEGKADGVDSALGVVPTADALETDGLDLDAGALETLLTVDPDELRQQLPQVREHLARFGDELPGEIRAQFEELERRLG